MKFQKYKDNYKTSKSFQKGKVTCKGMGISMASKKAVTEGDMTSKSWRKS